ncbi:MAG: helicase-associated domain-containing protein [Anaerolineales bacterium]|jgi:hypothetical protein
MPTLFQSLQNQDFGQLEIIADLWGLTLQSPDVRRGRRELADLLLADKTLLEEVIEGFPVEEQTALADLLDQSGQIQWALFTQKYGVVREMGPGRRDREKPYLSPASAAERLWYYALIFRAFFDTPQGPQEFAYIPNDIRALLPNFLRTKPPAAPLSRPAAPAERAYPYPANDEILDHAATLLAALRMEFTPGQLDTIGQDWTVDIRSLTALLAAAGLVTPEGKPISEATRSFLEADRAAALAQLTSAWLGSGTYDDLRLVPHVRAEGEWHTNPFELRQAALGLIRSLDSSVWWSLPALLSSVKTHHPNFLRPDGDYDSWYLKDERTDEYLRGFDHWGDVEGAFLHHMITGTMHWLGMVDLAATQKGAPRLVFRFSSWAEDLFEGQPPAIPWEEDQSPTLNSQGQILVPRLAPRAARYLIARFCEWEGKKRDHYAYMLTPASLARATEQGLTAKHLVSLLQRYSGTPLPPNTLQALKRWEEHGTQIRFQQAVILQVNHPEILDALLDSSATRFLGKTLGPTTVTVNPGALERVRAILIQMGYLSEVDINAEEGKF